MEGPYRQGWYTRYRDSKNIVHKVVAHPMKESADKAWLTCPFDAVQGGPCGNGGLLTPEAWRAFQPCPEPAVAVD